MESLDSESDAESLDSESDVESVDSDSDILHSPAGEYSCMLFFFESIVLLQLPFR